LPTNPYIFILSSNLNNFKYFSARLRFVKPIINKNMDTSPEYIIYKGYKTYIVSNFQNWLVRDYNNVKNWDKASHMKTPLSSEYKFKYIDNYNKMLIVMPHLKFIEKIKTHKN
jgi:hypothetical protein